MDYQIRQWSENDIPALTEIWCSVFGDPEPLARKFLALLPKMGLAFVAEQDGVPVSVCYSVTGLTAEFVGYSCRCAYLYAVATLPAHRGHGLAAALCRECAEAAVNTGCHFLYTRPDTAELFSYYERVIGLSRISYCKTIDAPAAIDTRVHTIQPMSVSDYFEGRERFYAGRPHIVLSPECLEYEKSLCLAYDGNLFSVDSIPVAAYIEGGRLVVREVCCPSQQMNAVISALCSYVNQNSFSLRLPSDSGELFIESNLEKSLSDFEWGIVFD